VTRGADLLLDTLTWQEHRTPDAPAWAGVLPPGLERLVAYEGGALWLTRRLAELGIRPSEPFRTWLDKRAKDDLARNLMVEGAAVRVLAALRALEVPHVFLKGMAWRLRPAVPYAGARPLRDVDVLVPETRAREVWDALVAEGYTAVLPEGHGFVIAHHLPALFAPGGASVELHTSASHQGRAADSWNRVWPGAVPAELDGRETRVPAMTEMLWHAVEHAVHDGTEGFRLRRWLDVVVALRSEEPIRWPDVTARLGAGEIPAADAARAWLGAAAELAGREVPRAVLGSVAPFDLRRALRWRSAVLARRLPTGRIAIPLLEEGTREALGWPPSPSARGRPAYVRTRHRLAAAAARAWYRCWRAVRGR